MDRNFTREDGAHQVLGISISRDDRFFQALVEMMCKPRPSRRRLSPSPDRPVRRKSISLADKPPRCREQLLEPTEGGDRYIGRVLNYCRRSATTNEPHEQVSKVQNFCS